MTETVRKSAGELDEGLPTRSRNIKVTGLVLGILLGSAAALLLPDTLAFEARAVAGIGVLMGVWWATEAIPLAATALIPLVMFPVLQVAELGDFSGNYASSTIFLFLGGFLIALAMQRWNLHRRIALRIVLMIGTQPTRLIAGFMIATAFLSMWVSNTATAMMMIPMGMSVLALVEDQRSQSRDLGGDSSLPKTRFGVGLMIGIAYAATIGGVGTIIGSPVNVVVVGYIRESLGHRVTFIEWFMVGFPCLIILLTIGWVLIAKLLWRPEEGVLSGGREFFEDQLRQMGRMPLGERIVAVVFTATAMAWILVPLLFEAPWVDDTVIAMTAGLLLFLLPARPREGVMVMNWGAARQLPWDVLLLFGGGLALSSQVEETGLAIWLGESLEVLAGVPIWVLVAAIILMLLLLTEFTSSTATAATFVPVVGGIAIGLGLDPVILAVAAGMACLSAYMLPVGTPPNAVAFGSGAVTIAQMIRTGLWMNLVSLLLMTVVAVLWVPVVFG